MWTKICGFTDEETARFAVDAGADAIGINFYPKSARSTDVTMARNIVAAVGDDSLCVGLFVNEPFDDLVTKVKESGVQAIQLHGDEPPHFLVALAVALPDHSIIKAFAVDHVGLHMVDQYLGRCRALGRMPWACLLDAKVIGQRGGTGQVAPWEIIEEQYREDWPPLLLAGGLHIDNVADAVNRVEPWGIDIASGAERERAVKDPRMMSELLAVTKKL
ncbi:MAG: phosphoribosylanthranilate isomerase [Planctomycetaceae bacterium]